MVASAHHFKYVCECWLVKEEEQEEMCHLSAFITYPNRRG